MKLLLEGYYSPPGEQHSMARACLSLGGGGGGLRA